MKQAHKHGRGSGDNLLGGRSQPMRLGVFTHSKTEVSDG
ncbi:hypothetical protein HRbin17_01538 [bacterium HR17]|jgi:hypothetical protein|uniref:Uncharacterized protein n=1 Tax=Candidatus Fervidibacter japonicus TaxID=2035412 RepID=A0A2H5XD02_9BACT|nr:hypothetical protein HRbin17_01538 [bacterium HR17]